jgi:hypothetical protein
MAKRNADIPFEQRIEFRIGIHQGDIIVEDGDIFGDGVNLAARLEPRLTREEPGAMISRGVDRLRERDYGGPAGPPLSRYIRAVSDRRRRARSRHPLWG